MKRSRNIIVSLNIPADEYLRVYSGVARTVVTHSIDGRSVRFPANILQPFVTREGIRGRFCIFFTEEGKFDRIERV
ncbi:DUF2835 domain-containing protein [Litoribacillus peritrichatus]